MKQIIALLLLLALVAPAQAKDDAGAPAIEFAEMSHDFGTIAENGGKVSHEFVFTNTGQAPLTIVKAAAACGCTRPTYTTHPVQPGERGKVKVTYLPEGRPGEFVKTVRVTTNAKPKKKITLTIRGFVTPADKK